MPKLNAKLVQACTVIFAEIHDLTLKDHPLPFLCRQLNLDIVSKREVLLRKHKRSGCGHVLYSAILPAFDKPRQPSTFGTLTCERIRSQDIPLKATIRLRHMPLTQLH